MRVLHTPGSREGSARHSPSHIWKHRELVVVLFQSLNIRVMRGGFPPSLVMWRERGS